VLVPKLATLLIVAGATVARAVWRLRISTCGWSFRFQPALASYTRGICQLHAVGPDSLDNRLNARGAEK